MPRRNARIGAASSGTSHRVVGSRTDLGHLMTWLRAFGRFFEQKIGLHRLGVVLSLIIIAVAAVVLYRKLHNINVSKVLTAMATVEYRDVAISALFVAARLFHADLLRPVRAAHDRPQGRALSHRGAGRLHLLFGRPQCRRQRLHRRRGALPHLFGLGPRRHRGRQDLLHRRADLLARQRHRAGLRLCLPSAGGLRHRPAAAVGQPRARHRAP